MSDTVRVLVVDDSATTRTMLREALGLAGGIEVVGEANDGREAVAIAADLQPDVVLMDIRMPDGDGIQAAREITARSPSTKIVALTWLDDAGTVREMLAAGAMGYVVKGGTMDELADAIRRAKEGEAELDHRVLPAAVEDLRRLLEQEMSRREELERLDRARGAFVQVLSPELRTPLTVLRGNLEAMRDGVFESTPEALADMHDDVVRLSKVVAELQEAMGISSRPDAATIARWPRAFPQYQVGHLERVARIQDALARQPGLVAAGASYRGVGIPACISQGREAARAVLEQTAAGSRG